MSGRIPDAVVDEVSRRTDILEVVGSYVNLSRKGDRWWGLCPFHNEKTPSFSVSQDSNLFYCFGCHKGGGIYQFLMEMESLTFPESVRRLAEKVGVDIPELGDDGSERDKRKALADLYARVSNTFRWLLLNHPDAEHARQYLRSRAITDETAEIYRLGWAPADGEWLYHFLIEKKYSPEFLAESGLFSGKSPRWSFFVDRLMFPVMPDNERVLAFSGRALSDRGPKYKNSPETVLYRKSEQLYGLGQARKAIRSTKNVYLCEGNIDVLAACQSGFPETVAPLGTAFTDEQGKILKRLTDSIILVFDGDSAGKAATMKAAITAEKAGLTVRTAAVPEGRDPGDILENDGTEKLKNVLNRPINIFSYLLDFLISAKSATTGEAKEEALKELTPYLNAVESDVRREAYLSQLAEVMNANPDTVLREYQKRTAKRQSRPIERRDAKEKADAAEPIGDDLYLMAAVAIRCENFSVLRTMLAPEMLRDRRALAVYRVMDELSVAGNKLRTDAIVAKLQDPSLSEFIIQNASTELFDEAVEETIREKIRLIRVRALTEESRELVSMLSKDDASDPERTKARMLRIKEIDQEIMKIRQGEDGGNQI